MPFKLCNSEKKRLEELIDQVNELSDTVDELRANVNAMKICSIVASHRSLTDKRNRREASTLHKLKRCLEKSFIPVFSRDPTSTVRKKCQQMFSQFPTIMARPCNECSMYQHSPSSSYTQPDNRFLNYEIPPTRYLYETKPKRRDETIQFHSQRHNNVSKNSKKGKSLHVSSSSSKSSENTLIEPYESFNNHGTYETCDSSKSSRKIEDLDQIKKKKVKNKTTGTVTSPSTSPIKVASPKNQFINSETVKHQRGVTFVNRKKKIAVEKDLSVNSSLLSNNISGRCLEDRCVIYTRPDTDFNVQSTINGSSSDSKNKKKRSPTSSARCSIDCEYWKKLPSFQNDVCTNTLSHNLSRENKSMKIKNFKKVRRKSLANQKTQTSFKLDKYREEICFAGRRHCPNAKRDFSGKSLSSLTSCSPRSISSFLESEELDIGQRSMHTYCKREPESEEVETFKNKRKIKVSKRETDNAQRAKLVSSREPTKKSTKGTNTKPQSNRRKRTYVINSDIPVAKINKSDQCNCDEEQENSSSIGDSTFQENKLKERKIRKWKKPEVKSKVYEGHQPWKKQEFSCQKDDNRVVTSVCKNQRTNRFFPKVERLASWTLHKRQKKSNKLMKFRESTSSSCVCTDETYSLTSNPQLSRSNRSITSDRFNRNERPTKEFHASVCQ